MKIRENRDHHSMVVFRFSTLFQSTPHQLGNTKRECQTKSFGITRTLFSSIESENDGIPTDSWYIFVSSFICIAFYSVGISF